MLLCSASCSSASWRVRWVISFLWLSLIVTVVGRPCWELAYAVDIPASYFEEKACEPSIAYYSQYRSQVSNSTSVASSSQSREVDIVRPPRIVRPIRSQTAEPMKGSSYSNNATDHQHHFMGKASEFARSPTAESSSIKDSICTDVIICTLLAAFVAVLYRDTSQEHAATGQFMYRR